MRRGLAVVLAVAALGACGDDAEPPSAEPAGCVAAEHGQATVVAEDLAWFPDCVTAAADEPLTIVLDNRDNGVNHNLHLRDAPGDPKTALDAGPVTEELEVTLAAGEYPYVCDIHPNMVGRLVVADANPAAP